MHLGLLLEMAAGAMGDRVAVGRRADGMTTAELAAHARVTAARFSAAAGERVVLVDVNSEAVPIVLFGAALAGKAFVPVNYRLADDRLRAIVARAAPAVVVAGPGAAERLVGVDGIAVIDRLALLEEIGAAAATADEPELPPIDDDPATVAVLLFTSGTTGEPKAAVLRHQNLAAYIISTVEFAGADEDQAALVSVPPYHIAGISAVLSSLYAGRRIAYLEAFEAEAWVDLARREQVTHAMVVPTMLGRIVEVLEADGEGLPCLRTLSYGGGPMPGAVIERALAVLPDVGFVNAYGLTETSSTIALLGPDEHREAVASTDPEVRRRLGSVGRPLPSVEVSIRDPFGAEVPTGEPGEVWVRGEQVSGEYLGRDGGLLDGWFRTRDGGRLDAAGYLYVGGRLDDVIVRGGENLSPGEIEAVLVEHPAVAAAAVVGIPDDEWGERVVAAVVLSDGAAATEEELRDHVRARLRSTQTPERIDVRTDLPFNETGKLLRRTLRDELAEAFA